MEMPSLIREVKTEFNEVVEVLMCKPTHFLITQPINEFQRFWLRMKNPPRKKIALNQHKSLINTVKDLGVRVSLIKPISNLNFQVYTRDLGFLLSDECFLASRMSRFRRREEKAFLEFLGKLGFKILSPPRNCIIEGGNIIAYDSKRIFIGISERTNIDALKWMSELIKVELIPVRLKKGVIHLDLALNFPSREVAVLFEEGVENCSELIKRLKEMNVNVVRVNWFEFMSLAVNFMPLRENLIVAAKENNELNKRLERIGVEVVEVEFGEILKGGGGIRCTMLPIKRK